MTLTDKDTRCDSCIIPSLVTQRCSMIWPMENATPKRSCQGLCSTSCPVLIAPTIARMSPNEQGRAS